MRNYTTPDLKLLITCVLFAISGLLHATGCTHLLPAGILGNQNPNLLLPFSPKGTSFFFSKNNSDTCRLVCPGHQDIILPTGQCEWEIPNIIRKEPENCNYKLSQISTIGIGNVVGPGQYTMEYQLTDTLGQSVDSCSFTISIVPELRPTTPLRCKSSGVFYSNENCLITISASSILPGGPYDCLTSYNLNVRNVQSTSESWRKMVIGESSFLSSGRYHYELLSPAGGLCRGTFTVRDTTPPRITCPCEDKIRYSPADSLTGYLTSGDFQFGRCDLNSGQTAYSDLHSFEVTATGRYLLRPAYINGNVYAAVYSGRFDPNSPCQSVLASVDSKNYNGELQLSVDLIAGKRYILLYSSQKDTSIVIPYTILISGPGMLLSAENASENVVCFLREDDLTTAASETLEVLTGTFSDPLIRVTTPPFSKENCGALKTDFLTQVCGNRKLYRHWTFTDSTGNQASCRQVFRFHSPYDMDKDTIKPDFTVQDTILYVDSAACISKWDVAPPRDVKLFGQPANEYYWGVYGKEISIRNEKPNYVFQGQPGIYNILYWVEDCYGNRTEKYTTITVKDSQPPVVRLKDTVVFELQEAMMTYSEGKFLFHASQHNNGSSDNCQGIQFEIRRLDGGACGNVGLNGYNNNVSFNNHNGIQTEETGGQTWLHAEGDHPDDTDCGRYVAFCCDDVSLETGVGFHAVEIRAWDNANRNYVFGDNFIINGQKDNFNSATAIVRVENKSQLHLTCPGDVIIPCDADIPLSLNGIGTHTHSVDMSLTGTARGFDICREYNVQFTDTLIPNPLYCDLTTILRTFHVTRAEETKTCIQRIERSFISFPQRGGASDWNKCSLGEEDIRDQNNPVIKRPVFHSCGLWRDSLIERIEVDTFLFEDGACKKWRVTYKYTNRCTGQEITTINRQPIIYYYSSKDVFAPVLTCANQVLSTTPNPTSPDGACQAEIVLEASATDDINCDEANGIKWQAFMDVQSNGTTDRIGSSFVNKAWKGIWVRQDKFVGGQLNPSWVAIQYQHPNVVLADLIYVTYVAPIKASGGSVSLPVFFLEASYSTHKVFWKVTDGCGNIDQYESIVRVDDNQPPSVECIPQATVFLQFSPKMVEVCAKDFIKSASDNCTSYGSLMYTFRENGNATLPVLSRLNEDHYFREKSIHATLAQYNSGKAYKWLPYARTACRIFSSPGTFPVEIEVWDEYRNSATCTVQLTFVDPSAGERHLVGTVRTETGLGVADVSIKADANSAEYPKIVKTNEQGNYSMVLPRGIPISVTACKDGDDRNGVSTLDAILIQRHILGISRFTSPYKMLAADVNGDRKVTTADITEIRKVILGIQNDFTATDSWKFHLNHHPLLLQSPFNIVAVDTIAAWDTIKVFDFKAVKMGDVNGSAITSFLSSETERRTTQPLELYVEDRSVRIQESVDIPIRVREAQTLFGFQSTFRIQGGVFESFLPGRLPIEGQHVGIHAPDLITLSFAPDEVLPLSAEDILFTLRVRANKSGSTTGMLSCISDITKAEYYTEDFEVGSIALKRKRDSFAAYFLYQNTPNPFTENTEITFDAPHAGEVMLSVYDVTGKEVCRRWIQAKMGTNHTKFTGDDLGQQGVLFCVLRAAEENCMVRMLRVD